MQRYSNSPIEIEQPYIVIIKPVYNVNPGFLVFQYSRDPLNRIPPPSLPLSTFSAVSTTYLAAAVIPTVTLVYIRGIIQQQIEISATNNEILAYEQIYLSLRTIQRIRQSFNDYGLVQVEGFNLRGRPRKLDKQAIKKLLEFLYKKLSAFLNKIAYFLFDKYNYKASKAIILKVLKTIGYSK